MDRELKLNQLEPALAELDYPVTPAAVARKHGDVTLVLADGETTLGRVVADANVDRFESAEDLATEVFSLLPRRAVGEPFQSDGDA
ncbi:MAG: hypothetical protein V5A82_11265 [Haloferacaceae archaeon]